MYKWQLPQCLAYDLENRTSDWSVQAALELEVLQIVPYVSGLLMMTLELNIA